MIFRTTTRLYLLDFFRRCWWVWPIALIMAGCLGLTMEEGNSPFSMFILPALFLSNLAIIEDRNIGRLKILRMLPVSEKQLAMDMWLKQSVVLPLLIVSGFLGGAFLNIIFSGNILHSSSVWYSASILFLTSVAIMSWSHIFYGLLTNTPNNGGALLSVLWLVSYVAIICTVIFVPDRRHATPEETLGIMFLLAAAMSGAHYGFARTILRRAYRNPLLTTKKPQKKGSKHLLKENRSDFNLSSPHWSAFTLGLFLVVFVFGMQVTFNLIADIRPLWTIDENSFVPLLMIGGLMFLQVPTMHWMSAMRAFGSLPMSARDKANLLCGIPFVTLLPALALILLVHPLEGLGAIAFVWYAGLFLLLGGLALLSSVLCLQWGYRVAIGGQMFLLAIVMMLTLTSASTIERSGADGYAASFTMLCTGSAMYLAMHYWLQKMFKNSSEPYRKKTLPWAAAAQQ